MFFHRLIRVVCLAGAATAPITAALICRFISRIAVKDVIPRSGGEPLPAFTETWIVGVANGSFPLIQITLLLSVVVATLGVYILFSKRLSTDAVASALPVVCCVAYALAVALVGSSLLALVIPFLPMAAK